MDELESGQWACDKCTYINDQNDLTCVMCYTVRTATKDLPVTWQWQAADQWIPYDLPACLQIEDAFKAGKSSVRLSQGWFASNHGYTVTFQKLKSTPSIQRSHSSQSQSTVSHSHSEVSEPSHSSQHEHEHDEEDDHDDMQQDSKSSQSNSSTSTRTSGYRFFQTNTDSGNVRKVRRLANDDDSAYITLQPSQLTLQDKCGVCQEGLLGEDDDTSLARAASNTSLGRSASGSGSGSGSGSRSRPSSESGSKSSIPSTTTTASPATTAMTRTSSTTSSPSSLPIVKLPKCDPGHAFHRDCIAQWLKLKDHCPFCQKRI